MLEIERKFLILRPSASLLENFSHSEIEQTYLLPNGRVRARKYSDRTVYTHTLKTAITEVTRIEEEREVTAEEYISLLKTADPIRKKIKKTRYLIPFNGFVFELDDFGESYTHALMEIELESEDTEFTLPNFVTVIREVTHDKRYRNSSIAKDGFWINEDILFQK